jgi:hypothetical protein
MKVALINPISKTVNELCADHEIRAWGRKSGNVIVDVPTGFPVKSISDVKAFGPDVVVVEKRGNGVFREFAKNFDRVVDVAGLRLLLSVKPVKKEPEPVPEPVVVKKEPEPEPEPVPEPVPEVVAVAAAAVAEVEEVIQETPKPKKSSRKKKTPTKSST